MGNEYEADLPVYAPRSGYHPALNPTYAAPPPEYTPSLQNPSSPPPPSRTITNTVYIPVHQPELGKRSQRMICPNCHKQIKTKVTYHSGGSAWASCCLLACLGCCMCCLLPFCMDSFQNIEHKCPKCKAYIGKYRK